MPNRMASVGEHGGVVKRKFDGAGQTWRAGETISPEIAQSWSLKARTSLQRASLVYWYEEPETRLPNTVTVILPDGTVMIGQVEADGDGVVVRVLPPTGDLAPRRAVRRTN